MICFFRVVFQKLASLAILFILHLLELSGAIRGAARVDDDFKQTLQPAVAEPSAVRPLLHGVGGDAEFIVELGDGRSVLAVRVNRLAVHVLLLHQTGRQRRREV